MKKAPLVSVAMGIYNCADTLAQAVECIREQTYEKWELILCDDCSTDDTYVRAVNLAKADSRITVLRNEKNLTLAPTLNRCIRHANGAFIARMDGDDTCTPDRLEKELRFLLGHPDIAIVSCNMEMRNENGVFRTIHYREWPALKDFVRGNQHCHAACIVRADALRAVGGYSEAESRRRVEDYDLWVRMYAAGYRGYNIQEPLYCMFDSTEALKRRSFQNRKNESSVILQACRAAKLPPHGYFRAAIPILKWLVPKRIYQVVHK